VRETWLFLINCFSVHLNTFFIFTKNVFFLVSALCPTLWQKDKDKVAARLVRSPGVRSYEYMIVLSRR